LELQQGKNIADAAATVEGLGRYVISALCDASKWSKGKYTRNYHFDSKARIVDYIQGKYPQLAAKMSVLHVGSYMDNWKSGMMFSRVCLRPPDVRRIVLKSCRKKTIIT
jgi:hypothetical protein